MKKQTIFLIIIFLLNLYFYITNIYASEYKAFYVPGVLAHVSVGSDGEVWGLNHKGTVYKFLWNGYKYRWTKMYEKRLKQISVGNANIIWGIDLTGNPLQLIDKQWCNKSIDKNKKIQIKWISVGNDGEVWAIPDNNDDCCAYRWNKKGQKWDEENITNNKNKKICMISVVDANNMWAVDNSEIVYYRESNKKWNIINYIRFKHISAGIDNTVWGINHLGYIYYKKDKIWERINGNLRIVSVGNKYNIWGVSDTGFIYRWVYQN